MPKSCQCCSAATVSHNQMLLHHPGALLSIDLTRVFIVCATFHHRWPHLPPTPPCSLVASYTANLAAVLTSQAPSPAYTSLEQLRGVAGVFAHGARGPALWQEEVWPVDAGQGRESGVSKPEAGSYILWKCLTKKKNQMSDQEKGNGVWSFEDS